MSVKCPVSIRKFPDGVFWIVDADGERIADDGSSAGEYGETMSLDTARRIVACVNAMAGIGEDNALLHPSKNPLTVRQVISGMKLKELELEQQRDELLAVLEELAELHYPAENYSDEHLAHELAMGSPSYATAIKARAIIAKAKGGDTDRSAIEEFTVVWFESTQEWVAMLPNCHVLRGGWGAVGYAVSAAMDYLGRGESEFHLPDGGDGTFFRYEKDDEYWQGGPA